MLRIFLAVLAVLIWEEGYGQLKKFYSIKSANSYDTVVFSLKATVGTCFVNPSNKPEPLNIYGNPTFSDVNPTFDSWQEGVSNYVNLFLEDYNQKGLSQVISYSIFGDEKFESNFWKMYLSEEKVYKLDFQYGIGDAFIDLSNLSIAKMRIESGSANVNVAYSDFSMNKCKMDTLYIKVDFGSIDTKNIHLARAKTIIADIGFGTAVLDFSKASTAKCSVNASIGAGKLKVILSSEDYPAIIYFKNSPLCSFSCKTGFEEIKKDVFVNKGYLKDSTNSVQFNVDVAFGKIVFNYAK